MLSTAVIYEIQLRRMRPAARLLSQTKYFKCLRWLDLQPILIGRWASGSQARIE
jgi:hypothetical protein